MEEASIGVLEYLVKTYGLAGIVIAAQGLVIWRQMKRNETLQTKFDTMMELRVDEAKESTKALEGNTEGMNRLAEFIKDRLRPMP